MHKNFTKQDDDRVTATIIVFRPMAELPNRIRELRKARGWTLQQMADRLNCAVSYVSNLERGERELSYHWMKRIARLFKVAPADLLVSKDNSRSLTAEEHELLGLFGQADDSQRRQIMQMIRILLGSNGNGKRHAA